MPILEIKNLIKKYHTKNVIDNISLNVDSGKIVGLLGPNGSGKTTLIKLLAGLLTATSGDILIDNAEQIAAKYNIIDKYWTSILSNISKNNTGIINTIHNKIEVGKNIFILS